MASVERSEECHLDINKLFDVITDYVKYPDFVDGVSGINILRNDDKGAKIEYSLNLIKKFKYTLEMVHERPNRVSWTLLEGDLFKTNKGFWQLDDLGDGKVKATYSLDVGFKVLAPKMIVNKLVSNNLPAMMRAYFERAKEI